MKTFYKLLTISCIIILLFFESGRTQTGWEVLNSGTGNDLQSVHFVNADTGYVVGQNATILKTVDGGSNWQALQSPISQNLNDVFFFGADTGVVVGDGGTILRTVDGGLSWTPVSSGISDDLLSVSFVEDNGIAGGYSQSILYSSDSGASWSIAQSGFLGGGFYGAFMLSPDIGIVGGENSVFQPLMGRTMDGGVSWNFHSFLLNGNEGKIFGINFTDMNTGYAGCGVWDGRGAIAKTTDGGVNWTTTFFNDIVYDVYFPISNASLIGYSVGAGGLILKTETAGQVWQQQDSGVSSNLQAAYFLDLDTGYVVGEGGMILKTTTGGVPPIKIVQQNMAALPASFRLIQNYPNPFNPQTHIKFEIPVPGNVELTLYDIWGRKLKVLASGAYPAGTHEVVLIAENLPAGIYFYRLKSGKVSLTGKCVLAK